MSAHHTPQQRRRLAAIQASVMVRPETKARLKRLALHFNVRLCDVVDMLLDNAFPARSDHNER